VSGWFLLIVSILSGTAGDLLTAKSMRDYGEIHDFRPGAVARTIAWLSRDFSMPTGILAQAVSFFPSWHVKVLLSGLWRRFMGK
jgi:hypothetical protein